MFFQGVFATLCMITCLYMITYFIWEVKFIFLSEGRSHLGEYAANHGFSRIGKYVPQTNGFLCYRKTTG